MSDLVFTLPMPPNYSQQGRGWKGKHFAKKRYYATLDMLVVARLLAAPPDVPWSRVRVSAVMYLHNRMDTENAVYRASKFPMDYLKSRGYIIDDNERVVHWEGKPEQRITRKEDPKLILTLTPLDLEE